MSESQENDANFTEKNSSNTSDARNSSKKGDIIIVPKKPQIVDREENLSPTGGKYHLRPNPNPNYSEDFRYLKRVKLRLEMSVVSSFLLFSLASHLCFLKKYGDV